MEYKHCQISQKFKLKYHKNPISGHEWTEHIPLNAYHVYGGKLINRSFRSVSKAQEAIDFDFDLIYGKFAHLSSETFLKNKII